MGNESPYNREIAMAAPNLNNAAIKIEILVAQDEHQVSDLIRKNLSLFDEAGSVLSATFRRLDGLWRNYRNEGCQFLVAKLAMTGEIIGGAGIGPLAGLPVSEGIGEIRDLVIDDAHRGHGYGKLLLGAGVQIATECGYKQLYLKTTPEMRHAQQLFTHFGFRPVTQGKVEKSADNTPTKLPCYFLLEELLNRQRS